MASSPFVAILVAIASFFVITLIFSIIYVICRIARKDRRVAESRPRTRAVRSRNRDTSTSVSESQLFDPSLNKIEMVDLVNATRNFSPDLIVGDGSFGYVYKARLTSGVTVAVKKLGPDAFQGYREFKAEMETLGNIRQHDNIVKFLGYCATGSDQILIYEFIEKGSLDQWLYDTSSIGPAALARLPLSWRTRINIIKGVAKGLEFMHNLDKPIIHRDIKASNVLLDADFEAHIADFGLARTIQESDSHVSTQVAGTMGYMPPEYIHGATAATVAGDVYSFGILMFEVATARRPNLRIKDQNGREIRLVEWVMNMVSQNQQMKLLDARILKDELNKEEVHEYLSIATFCISEIPKLRPTMKEVINLFNQI